MRHPILLWDDWEVMLIAWQSGQITPIHDHRGVLGGMVVLSGTLAEERFTTPAGRPELSDSRARPEGDLSEIGPTTLHRLMPGSARAVSLHIYRPPLRTMGIWEDTGMVSIMPSAFDVGRRGAGEGALTPAQEPGDARTLAHSLPKASRTRSTTRSPADGVDAAAAIRTETEGPRPNARPSTSSGSRR